MPSLSKLFDKLWEQYVRSNPHAQAIHDLLAERGETIQNDHVAFRTFDDPRVNVDVLSRTFLSFGYQIAGEYDFEVKRLNARHLAPPEEDLPKVFIYVQADGTRFEGFIAKSADKIFESTDRRG